MKLKLNIKGKKHNIEIKERDKNTVEVSVDGEDFIFKETEGDKRKILPARTAIPKRDFSEKEIKALITGTISEVFVKAGDFIKKDQKVVLLSAMKMENEIVSDYKGKVKDVLVKKDQKVKEGEVLIILE